MKPRLWIVTPELHRRGGTERSVAELVDRWRDDWDITLYTMEIEGIDVRGLRVRQIPRMPGPHLVRYVYFFVVNTGLRWLDRRKFGPPDVLHAPGINCLDADVIGVYIVFLKHWEFVKDRTKRDLRNPRTFLRTLHRVLYWKLLHHLERRVYGGTASLWAISQWDATFLEERFGKPPGSVAVVPIAVDSKSLSGPRARSLRASARAQLRFPSEQRVVYIFGNDFYRKGIDVALRAMTHLPDDVVLAVRGTFDTTPLRRELEALGLAARVRLVPPVGDPILHYAAADVVIAPSREDSFSLPPLEALACEVPVVTAKTVGFAELLEDERHALILPDPEDDRALAAAIERLLNDEALRESLRVEGRRLAEACNWEEAARRISEMFRLAADRGSRR